MRLNVVTGLMMLGILMNVSAARGDTADDMETMRQRTRAFYSGQMGPALATTDEIDKTTQAAADRLDARVKELMAAVPATPDPSRDDPNAIGRAVEALYRAVMTMTQAYAAPASSLHGSPELRARIEQEMRRGYVWIAPGTPRPGNWYQWQLATPRLLGPALLLLEGSIDADLHARHIDAMADLMQEPLLNGANAVWDARNRFYLGLLERDPAIIDTAWSFLLPELTIHSGGGGILEDFSYHFHGRLLHTAGYGGGLAESAARLIAFSDGTRWSASPGKRAVLGHHLAEHARWVIIGQGYDLSVKGRGVLKGQSAISHVTAMLLMSQVDSPARESVREAAAEVLARASWTPPLETAPMVTAAAGMEVEPLTGFRFFPQSDFAVRRADDWYTSVRMYSDRLIDYEGNWGQNMQGWFLAYGLTYVTRDGQEIYREPAILEEHWDWHRLPGTTTRVGVHPEAAYNQGTSPFAGGAGDGGTGLCGFILEPAAGDYVARKSVFFFDRGFIAAGDGITATAEHAEPVVTTVTQWAGPDAKSPLVVSGAGEIGPFDGAQRWDGVTWAWYDGVGYVFPEPVTLWAQRRGPVVTLWLDHGASPRDAGYAYVVLPTVSRSQAEAFAADPDVRVVRRDETAHAFEATGTGSRSARGAVFWAAGEAAGLTADGPAVVYAAEATGTPGAASGAGVVVAAQRPLHDPATLTVSMTAAAEVSTLPAGVRAEHVDGRLTVTLPTVAGRVYRIGLDGAQVTQPPRIEHDAWEAFSVHARSRGRTTDLIVTLPEPARHGNYRLQALGSKGHLRKEFTDDNIVERLEDGRLHYRWHREGEGVKPDDFRLVLICELHHTQTEFTVPDP